MTIGIFLRSILAAALALVLLAASRAHAQTNTAFIAAGPATWNSGDNWDPAFVPEAQFNEIAVIDGGRSAFVNDNPPDVGGIVISAGTLEIRSGGDLTAAPGTLVSGDLVVGQGGTGNLIVRRGGSLSVQNLSTGGSATSQITLGETGGTGTAMFQTAGGALSRTTRIVGANVGFTNTGDLTFAGSSVLNPVITGATHSTINVTGTAALDGTLRPEFSGYTPVLGNSWSLVTAGSISGAFSTIDTSQLPATPRGTGFALSTTPTAATLRFTNKLILSVNRATGLARIENVVGAPIALDAYTITSTGGNLDGAWNSLDDQNISAWDEADSANNFRRTEFNPSASSTINVGSSLSLGNVFSPPVPSALGEAVEDLSFAYAVPGQGTVEGIVEYTGPRNNLVLTIDPVTGAAAIQNESPFFDVEIDAYTITSTSGRLQTAAGEWNSLQDQNLSDWDEANNASSFRLTEFNPTGTTPMAGGGTVLNLGTPVNTAGGQLALSDFTFEFSTAGAGLGGDYNNNGVVDAADYVVWRDNLGSGTSLPNDNTPGVGPDDYARWKANFGNSGGGRQTIQGIVAFGTIPTATSGAGAAIAATAVPEPSTLLIALLLLTVVGAPRVRHTRRRVQPVRRCGH